MRELEEKLIDELNKNSITYSLNRKLPDTETEHLEVLEDNLDNNSILENQNLIQNIDRLLEQDDFTLNEKKVYKLYFKEPHTLEEVGIELGMARQTVHEIKNNLISKIKAKNHKIS